MPVRRGTDAGPWRGRVLNLEGCWAGMSWLRSYESVDTMTLPRNEPNTKT